MRDALSEARELCRRRKLRFTEVRERVLELIWQSHRPLGAYDILGSLAAEGHSDAPPTVYRALDFLLNNGLIHRIASLNAYTGCIHQGQPHDSVFLICRECQSALELDSTMVTDAIVTAAHQQGFSPEKATLEINGLCPACHVASTDD